MARQIDTDVNGASVAYVDAGDAATLATAEAYADAGDATTLAAAEAYTDAHTPVGANPTATAGSAAVNGVATTFMRSDAAPAVSLSSFTTGNLAEGVNLYFTNARAISAVGGITGEANPTASVGLTAVNGTATTCMRSDGAPALDQSIAPTWTGLHTFQITGGGIQSVTINGEGITRFTVARYSTDATPSIFQIVKHRGTIASPAGVIQNDVIFNLLGSADSGSGSNINALLLSAKVIEPTPSATAMGAQYTINLCPLGSATRTEVSRFEADTGFSMGGANPVIDQNRTHILRSYTTASPPTIVTGGLTFDSTYNVPVYGGNSAANLRAANTGYPITTSPTPRKLLNRLSFTPSVELENLIRRVYSQLSRSGQLTKLKGLWTWADPYSEYAAADGLINWITPGTGDCTVTGSVTYTAGQGRTGDGTTGYLNTGATMTALGALQDDIAWGVYIRTANSTKKAIIGSTSSNRRQVLQIGNSSTVTSVVSNATSDTYTPAQYTGLFQHYRAASTGWKWSLNGAAGTSVTRTSTALGTGNLTFLGTADGSGNEFSDGQVSFGFLASGGWTDTDAAALYSIMVGTWYNRGVYTVASLPATSATWTPQGTRLFVSDANATTFASTVAGGGANIVPVYNDGTNWKIG